MKIFVIIILTLVIYSLLTTLVIQISGCNDTVIGICGLGITGCIVAGICAVIRTIHKYFKYHYHKRSIFRNLTDGQDYFCSVKDCNDINWNKNYRIVKRYAPKKEWEKLSPISDEIIAICKINCYHCKYNTECQKKVKCEHNEYGAITDFNKFEKK